MHNARRKHHRRGIRAEYLALGWLMLKGYRPLAMRYKTPVGEIDLIMRRGRTLAIVEVKARKKRDDAATAVHTKNQSRIMRAAQHFMAGHGGLIDYQVRFDVCLIAWYRLPHHIPNAFALRT